MKTPVAVALIITGGFLIAAPLVSDYLQRKQVTAALAAAAGIPGVTSVNLQPTLSAEYRFGCWFIGSAMIAAAIASSRRWSGGSNN
jgi:hypothetical protein